MQEFYNFYFVYKEHLELIPGPELNQILDKSDVKGPECTGWINVFFVKKDELAKILPCSPLLHWDN